MGGRGEGGVFQLESRCQRQKGHKVQKSPCEPSSRPAQRVRGARLDGSGPEKQPKPGGRTSGPIALDPKYSVENFLKSVPSVSSGQWCVAQR